MLLVWFWLFLVLFWLFPFLFCLTCLSVFSSFLQQHIAERFFIFSSFSFPFFFSYDGFILFRCTTTATTTTTTTSTMSLRHWSEGGGGGGPFSDQDPLACRGAETFFLYLGISIWTSKCKIACLFSFFSVGSSLVFWSFFSSCNQTKHLYGKYQSSKLWQMGNWFLSLFIYHFTYASLFSSNLFISSISKSISIFFPCWTNCPNVSS